LNSAAKRTIHFFDTTIFQRESTSLTRMRAHSLSVSRFACLCTRAQCVAVLCVCVCVQWSCFFSVLAASSSLSSFTGRQSARTPGPQKLRILFHVLKIHDLKISRSWAMETTTPSAKSRSQN
jgi:hypothetical protein